MSILFETNPITYGSVRLDLAWASLSFGVSANLNRAAGAEENQQLKQLVADLSLDKQMLQEVIKKSFEATGPLERASSASGAGPKLDDRLSNIEPQSLRSDSVRPLYLALQGSTPG